MNLHRSHTNNGTIKPDSIAALRKLALAALATAFAFPVHADTIVYDVAFEYDEMGRQTAQIGQDAVAPSRTTFAYDNEDRLTKVTDGLQRTTSMAYDALGRLREVRDASNQPTQYFYDKGDRLTSVVDPRGLATTYERDGFGDLWKQVSPDSGSTSFVHDSYGRLTQQTRADGVRLEYRYDGLGRLLGYGGQGQDRSFTYDSCTNGKGLLCSASSSDFQSQATTDLTYTPQGQIASRRDSLYGGNGNQSDSVAYFYDAAGRLSSLAYPSGTAVGYSYTDGHLSAMTARVDGANVPIVQYVTAQPLGGIESWQYGNGLTRRYNRDVDSRVTGVSVGTSTSLVQSLTYAFDVASQITVITNGMNAALSQSYEYDPVSRLTRASRTGSDEKFEYNSNGNRTSHKVNNALFTLNYATTSNQLLTRESSSVLEEKSYRYDAQGQRTGRHGSMNESYRYDAFNRLVGVGLLGGTDTTYIYNALDQRVATSGYGQSADRFIYLGQNQMLGEYRHGEWRDYLWFGDELVGFVDDGELRYVHPDHLGRPEVVTDSNQRPVWRAANYAFDREVVQDEIGGLNLGFPGQYWEDQWGFWHNGMRDYDPEIGAYVQTDPIGLAAGIDTYAYVGGSPTAYTDQLGLNPAAGAAGGFWLGEGLCVGLPICGAVGAAVGFGIGLWVANEAIDALNDDASGDDSCPVSADAPGEPTGADGFTPPKRWNGDKVRSPNGRGYGWPDSKGNVWVPTGPGSGAHGGPHWDVQKPGGGYVNVYPGGRTRGGK